MKAAQISEYGDVSVIKVQEVEKPNLKAGQVLIEVHASSINPFDTTIRAGYMKESMPLQFPVTLGGDLAGVVAEVSEGVQNVSVGDKVYGQANIVAGNSGAFAEYAATSVEQIAKAPDNIDYIKAASLPLVGVSAWQALVKHIQLQSGQKIFIHGGAGGIGTIAVQIAKHLGAYVATTATGEGIDFVKQLGADEVVDYKNQNFTEVIRDYDAIFDTTPGEEFNASLSALKPGGVAVSMLAQADESVADRLGVTALTQSTHVTTEALDALRGLVEGGILTPQVGAVFELDQVQEAFRAREAGKVNGKVLLKIR